MVDLEYWSEVGLKEAYLKNMEMEVMNQLSGGSNIRKNPFENDLTWPIKAKLLNN